jgi:DNA (cytosine-5)-methyltransferase 1
MKILDLFSGIGGFSLGLESTGGFQTIAFCEKDKYCQRVLKKHWPDVPIIEDVFDERLSNGTFRRIDLICGGFPCQSFSVAGQQRGKGDDRYLWPRMFEIIRETRPTWVLCENVPGIISMALDEVLSDLAGETYSSQAFVIPACAVNAPHRRDRVWIVAHTNATEQWGNEWESKIKEDAPGKADNNVSDSNSQRQQEQRISESAEQKYSTIECGSEDVQDTDELRVEGERTEQQTTGINESIGSNRWTTESGICGMADGVSNRVERIKGLGNAVVPQVVAEIGKMILKAELET